jgi:hypothetical protein
MKIKTITKISIAVIIICLTFFIGYYCFLSSMYKITEKLLIDSTQLTEPDIKTPEENPGQQDNQTDINEKPSDPGQNHQTVQDKEPVNPSPKPSFSDKKRATEMVMSKLSKSDITYLQSLLKGGLTPEEERKAKELAYSRFSAAEIVEIKALYRKYK